MCLEIKQKDLTNLFSPPIRRKSGRVRCKNIKHDWKDRLQQVLYVNFCFLTFLMSRIISTLHLGNLPEAWLVFADGKGPPNGSKLGKQIFLQRICVFVQL